MSSLPPPQMHDRLQPDRRGDPPEDETRVGGSDIPPWPAWTAPAAIAAGFALGIVVSVIVGSGAKAGGSSLSHPSPAVSLIGDVLFDASFVAAALYFARLVTRVRPSDFGFRSVRWQ